MFCLQKTLFLVIASLIFLSCNNDTTASKMAREACNCFRPESDDLSDESREILVNAFRSNNWERTLAEELGKIKNEEAKSQVIRELESALNRRSFQKCMTRLDIRYRNRRFDSRMARRLADEMEDINHCELGAAFMDYASKHELNGNAAQEGEEEDDNFEVPDEDTSLIEE